MKRLNPKALPKIRLNKRVAALAAIALLVCGFSPGVCWAADEEPSDDDLRLARLVLENDIAAARFGKPAAGLEGKVEGANNLGNLAYNFQPKAYDDVAKEIKLDLIPSQVNAANVVITSRQNFGSLVTSAQLIGDSTESLVSRGLAILPVAQRPITTCGKSVGTTVPSLLAAAGAIESVVALFRTDYSIGTTAITNNELGLKLSMNSVLNHSAHIDGLDLLPVSNSVFLQCVSDLDTVKLRIMARNPAKDSEGAAFLAAAELAQSAMAKPTDSGGSAASAIASILSAANKANSVDGGVLYIAGVNSFATSVSARRLFSRNGKVHIYLTGTVNAAFSSQDGNIKGDTFTLGEARIVDLKVLMKDGGTVFKAATGN